MDRKEALAHLQIQSHLTIDDLDTLKVLTDPTRLEIMKQIGFVNKGGERCTVKHLAGLMEVAPSKLYYHIKLLEEHGLLVVGETQVVSGILEKHYQVAALDITFSRKALSTQTGPGDLALEEMLDSIGQLVNNGVADLRTSMITRYEEVHAAAETDRPIDELFDMFVARKDMVLTESQAKQLEKRLVALLDEFVPLTDDNLDLLQKRKQAGHVDDDAEEIRRYELIQMFMPLYHRRPQV